MTTTAALDIATPDGVADALIVTPDDGGPHPGVLLVMDAFGLRPQIERMAERIAAAGYVVLAPNLFYRGGRGPVADPGGSDRGALFATLGPLMAQLDGAAVARDAGAYLDELGRHTTGPVGLTGYCMGGAFALRAAAALPGIAAVGSFHAGRLVTDAPDSPHLGAGTITAELYLAHADHDDSMPPEAIATVEQALTDAGVTFTSELYEGAGHGFTMADMAVYDEAAAERHWRALLALLERTLR